MKCAWVQSFTWVVIVETIRQLWLPKAAFHAPTSDGYEPTRLLWEASRGQEMTLVETADVCRRCHRLAPFCNYNGNTFVAVIRRMIKFLGLPTVQEALGRSLAGHIVAGTATAEEARALAELLDKISHHNLPPGES